MLTSGRPLVIDDQGDIPEKMNTLFISEFDDNLAAILRNIKLTGIEIQVIYFGKLVE